jgi:nucleoid-associated protein YgaU
VPGDTLWSLAGRHLGDPERWRDIFAANRSRLADPDRLEPREQLRLPVGCDPSR